MIKILPSAKFSYNYSKGSVKSKQGIVDRINEDIFRNVIDLYQDSRKCFLKQIRKTYNSTLPENKEVKITPLPRRQYEFCGGDTAIDSKKGDYIGYRIEIPVDKKERMHIHDLPPFMHESTHVLDYLMNPKYAACCKKMEENEIWYKDYYDLFTDYFYDYEGFSKSKKDVGLKIIDEKMREKLKDVPFNEKLIFLNFIKYNMEMEQHAYAQDLKFANIILNSKMPIVESSLDDMNKIMYFPEKIQIINKYLAEEIQYERDRLTSILY